MPAITFTLFDTADNLLYPLRPERLRLARVLGSQAHGTYLTLGLRYERWFRFYSRQIRRVKPYVMRHPTLESHYAKL